MATVLKIGKNFFDLEIRRGMAAFVQATRSKLPNDLMSYMNDIFKPIFIKYCTVERENNIINNNIDDEGWKRIDLLRKESESLDYRKNIMKIMNPWKMKFSGHPQLECNTRLAEDVEARLVCMASRVVKQLKEYVLKITNIGLLLLYHKCETARNHSKASNVSRSIY